MSDSRKETDLHDSKPRGFYKVKEKWTQDTTTDYFEGFMNRFGWPTLKIYGIYMIGLAVHTLFQRFWLTILLCLLVINSYQILVARFVPNTIEMPPMDHQTFISSEGVFVNYMNCTMYDEWDEQTLKDTWLDVFTFIPKFRYKLKEIAGDLYYEQMPMQELVDKCFIGPESEEKILRSQDDINQYIADNMNQKMPMDGPQMRIYYQKYDPIDMDHLEKEKRPKGIMIWKCHHSLCDGVSSGSLILALSKEFDRSYFLASKDIKWYYRLLARVQTVFQVPRIAIDSAMKVKDLNFFANKRTTKLSGIINCSSSYEDIDLSQIKELSKYKGVTINDIAMCSLTTALNTIFIEQGETVEKIKMALPANLRFKFYKSRYHVKMENKFACLPLEVPLSKTMEESYAKINQATKSLKNGMGMLYSMYAMSYWCNKLFPRAFCRQICIDLSHKFTIALTNVPGAVKQFKYENKTTGTIIHNWSSRSYLMIAGNMGMGMCAFSQVGKLYMSFTSDDTICDRAMNKRIMDMTTKNILDEIAKMKMEKHSDQGAATTAAATETKPDQMPKVPLKAAEEQTKDKASSVLEEEKNGSKKEQ